MSRPLRIEFSGALYHVTSRGNAQQDIYLNDTDRRIFIDYLKNTCDRHQWLCYGFCLMTNHYHLLVETIIPSLSKGMKYLNGSYTQAFNKRHQRIGHLYQGRYKAILVEKDAHLLELSRYIALNPVRSGIVRTAKDWHWSSYRAIAGLSKSPEFLSHDCILSRFSKNRGRAQQAYRDFVSEGRGQSSPWDKLTNQIYLGSDKFVDDVQSRMKPKQSLCDIPKIQKQRPVKPLEYYHHKYSTRNLAMAEAYRSGHYTLKAVGDYFGVSYATVSRALKEYGV
jgi:REP element-mobilizing transposase RayT